MARRFFEFESFRVDVSERQLWRDGSLVPLTPKVFDMLLLLLENKGETVEKERLIREVWVETFVEEGSLNRNISTLRKALGDDSNAQRLIKTLPKRGYRFTDNVREVFEDPSPDQSSQHTLPAKPFAIAEGASPKRRYSRSLVLGAGLVFVLAFALTVVWSVGRKGKVDLDTSGLTAFEKTSLESRLSSQPEANREYIKGRALWHTRSAEALHQSILHLEKAIKLDPEFALAHSALADSYAFDVLKRTTAVSHAEEAIRLDPSLGQPHATIGFIRMFWEWNLPDANSSFRRSIELSPDYPTAHQWFALNLVTMRQGGAALAEMKRALELEPRSLAVNADLCQMYYFLQKYDDAISQCKKTLDADPNFLNAHLYLYETYTARGMYEEAVAEFFLSEKLKSDFALPVEQIEALRSGFSTGGIKEFWKVRMTFLERGSNSLDVARYYSRIGENEKAIRSLKLSHDKRDFDFVFVLSDPTFNAIRSDPEFTALTRSFE